MGAGSVRGEAMSNLVGLEIARAMEAGVQWVERCPICDLPRTIDPRHENSRHCYRFANDPCKNTPVDWRQRALDAAEARLDRYRVYTQTIGTIDRIAEVCKFSKARWINDSLMALCGLLEAAQRDRKIRIEVDDAGRLALLIPQLRYHWAEKVDK